MRGKVAALEKKLWLALEGCGLTLLNCPPQSKSELDETMWKDVRSAFASLGLSQPVGEFACPPTSPSD
jgi:hypothetical protein